MSPLQRRKAVAGAFRVRDKKAIVATPLGSSAYNMAANGPIVLDGIPAVALTPICCHSPLKVSLVAPLAAPIDLVVARGTEGVLWMDIGRGEVVKLDEATRDFWWQGTTREWPLMVADMGISQETLMAHYLSNHVAVVSAPEGRHHVRGCHVAVQFEAPRTRATTDPAQLQWAARTGGPESPRFT